MAVSRLQRDEMNLSGGSFSGISFPLLPLCSSSSSSHSSLVARLSRASFFARLREDRSALIAPRPGEGSKNEFDDREKETLVTRSSIEGTKRKEGGSTLIDGERESEIEEVRGGCVKGKWRRCWG